MFKIFRNKYEKLFDTRLFFKDGSGKFDFYYRMNWLGQFDLMVHDKTGNTTRWFMVTPEIFKAFLEFEDGRTIKPNKDNIAKGAEPFFVSHYIDRGFQILSYRIAGLTADAVLFKVGEFGPEDARKKVILLKRVAMTPKLDNFVLGMDTVEVPEDGVKKLIKSIKKHYFKGIDLKLEEEV